MQAVARLQYGGDQEVVPEEVLEICIPCGTNTRMCKDHGSHHGSAVLSGHPSRFDKVWT